LVDEVFFAGAALALALVAVVFFGADFVAAAGFFVGAVFLAVVAAGFFVVVVDLAAGLALAVVAGLALVAVAAGLAFALVAAVVVGVEFCRGNPQRPQTNVTNASTTYLFGGRSLGTSGELDLAGGSLGQDEVALLDTALDGAVELIEVVARKVDSILLFSELYNRSAQVNINAKTTDLLDG
jgi:hypothetical protein